MAYKLIKDHTKVNFNYGNSGRKYIVLHYTGNNTDTAQDNANYFRDFNRDASAHYFVDKKNVYEVVAPENTAWSVGINYGSNNLFGICNNANSISIEMCSTGGKIAQATFDNAVALTKNLMAKYNIPSSRVVRHYDVCSKSCPGWKGWVGADTSIWDKFKSALAETTYITAKRNAGLYNKDYKDPLGKTSKIVKRIPKGAKVKLRNDDDYGMSKVTYNGVTGYVFNSNFKDKLSTYKKVSITKGEKLLQVDLKQTKIRKTVKLTRSLNFNLVCIIGNGKYKGWYILTRGRWTYYYNPKQ